jgi:glycosyltransferase involved in cell wall biosynthesis
MKSLNCAFEKSQKKQLLIVHAFASMVKEKSHSRHAILSEHLNRLGITTTIVACKYSHLEPSRDSKRLIDGPEWLWVNGFSSSGAIVLRMLNIWTFGLLLHVKLLNKDYDYVMGSSPDPVSALSAFLFAKKLKRPFIYEIRDKWPETLIKLNGFSKYNPYVILLAWIDICMLKYSDAIITTLPQYYYEIQNKFPDKEVIYLPNFTKFGTLSKKPASNKSKFTFLYIGSLNKLNNVENVIEAARILEEEGYGRLEFRIFGDGTYRDKILEKSQAISSVSVFNRKEHEEIIKEIMNADAALICWVKSDLYSYGMSANKISDYLAFSLPIIMSSDYEHPIQLNDCGIVVPAENPSLLAIAIKDFCELSESRKRQMAKNARSLYDEEYSLEKNLVRFLKIFGV